MTQIFALVFLVFATAPALAQEEGQAAGSGLVMSADAVAPDDLTWRKRPIVVFADSPADPRFVEQMGYLTERAEALETRDVVVITDTDPDARSAWRQKLRPRGFGLVLLGKDGEIYLRKPVPWAVREITRSIDKLPLRQQELRDGGAGRS